MRRIAKRLSILQALNYHYIRRQILIRRLPDRKTRLSAGLVGLRGFGFGKQGKETAMAPAKKTQFDDRVFLIGVRFRGVTDP